MTPDQQLMAEIRAKYGAAIAAAVQGSGFPAPFLAALVANETGLNEAASRFEGVIFYELAFVLTGRKASYGAITPAKMKEYFSGTITFAENLLALQNLACSWGPTQIMGYQALAAGYPLTEISVPGKGPGVTPWALHFKHTVDVLSSFSKQFAGLGGNWESYLRCWNGGTPTAKTYDPKYVENGLARMAIYDLA